MRQALTSDAPLARVAAELEAAQGAFVSGQVLAERAGVSRNAVWKHVAQLRRLGYRIESARRLGHRILEGPDRPLPWAVRDGLPTRRIGREIRWFEVASSTQAEARRLAESGAPEGTVVVAEEQRAGRGRFRSAFSAPRGGLWFTVILRPPGDRASPTLISLLACWAVQRAIADVSGVEPMLVWPKELFLGGKKLGGVLAEVEEDQDGLAMALLGVGVNVNVNRACFPAPVQETAVSLHEAAGRRLPLAELFRAVLRQLDACYEEFLRSGGAAVADAWRQGASVLGKEVVVAVAGERLRGEAADLDDEGALLLRSSRGVVRCPHGVLEFVGERVAGR